MEVRSLRKLDDVLKIINVIGHHAKQSEINEKFREKYANDSEDIWDILEKLQDDRYIKKDLSYEEGFEGLKDYAFTYYKIRFEGLVFLEQGGYEGNVQKEKSEIELNKTIQFVIALTGAIAGYYYTLEVLINRGQSIFLDRVRNFLFYYCFLLQKKAK